MRQAGGGRATFAVAAVGLLIWGIRTKSDLNDANKQVKDLQSQVKHVGIASSAATASFKSAYEDLTDELGSTSKDLTSTQDDLKKAEQDATNAQKEADAAKHEADKAGNQTDKANAETKQAQAETKAAQSQAQLATDCANAALTGVGQLLQSDDPKAAVEDMQKQLQSFSDTCKPVLAGSD